MSRPAFAGIETKQSKLQLGLPPTDGERQPRAPIRPSTHALPSPAGLRLLESLQDLILSNERPVPEVIISDIRVVIEGTAAA